jgi:hypothetical protein
MWYTFDPEPPGDDCPDHGPHTGDCPKCACDDEYVTITDDETVSGDE